MKDLRPFPDPAPVRIRKWWKGLPGWNRWVLILVAVIVISVIFTDRQPPPAMTPEQVRKAQIEEYFSDWNGAHEGLESMVKSSIQVPDSYEHIKTEYWDKGDHLIVNMTYQADNAFGIPIQHFIKARTSLNGDVEAVLQSR